MIERLKDLEGRVQRTRTALENLAGRTSALRTRVDQSRAPFPTAPVRPFAPKTTDAPLSREESASTSALASSLDRLSRAAWISVDAAADAKEGDDGRFVSDAWEIALISEEGK